MCGGGGGLVEFGKIAIEPSKLGKLDSVKKELDLHFKLIKYHNKLSV